jgi:glycosidase
MKKNVALFFILTLLSFISFAQDTDFYSHPDWAKNASIYEVNVRQYTPEGTFKAFEKSLPRLKEMGVDILWIMPIYPIGELNRKGSLGSYYAVKDYQKVNPEFGTLDDFKELVNKAHSMGFKVILDWVARHSAPDNYLTKQHPDWYMHDSITRKIIPPVSDWTDVAGFNYDNKALWNYQIESMKFWIKNASVDGFRCDVAMMVPLEFWKQARLQLDSVKKVFMLAEAEGPEFNRNGFDMTYGWELLNLMNKVAIGEKDAIDVGEYIKKAVGLYKNNDYHMYFTSNHDENSWKGSEYERMGAGVACFDVLCFTLPGMPLIYSGQESAITNRLSFFDKDTIKWDDYKMQAFYKSLLDLKKNSQVLWNGDEGGIVSIIPSDNSDVLVFTRMKRNEFQTVGPPQIFVILNLSNTTQTVNAVSPFLLRKFKNMLTGETLDLKGTYTGSLKPWEYLILGQQ